MLRVAAIVGSLRKDSFNKKLLHALDKLDHPGLEFQIIRLGDIPLFNQDHEHHLPLAVANLKKDITTADGVLFVTPEYNRSVPGVLKNVIDWGARPYGQNSWMGKPTGIIGTSPGSIGTAIAQSHLRSIMCTLGAIVLGLPEVYLVYKKDLINDQFEITNEETKKFLQGFLDTFCQWVVNQASLRKD